VSAKIESVPVAPGATEEHALSGGDEYELLFTSSAELPDVIRIVWRRSTTINPVGNDHFSA
jgi:thiamine monophosphate kinase